MDFIKRYPALAYFALTFGISWGGFVIAVGPDGIPAVSEEFDRMPLLAIMAMLAGPAIAGIVLTGLVSGRVGFRDLLSRLLKWRVGIRWYAVALLTAPVLFVVVLLTLSLISPVFQPAILASDAPASLLMIGSVVGLIVGIFEELGWTGFVIPRLRLRYSVLATGLLVGVVWGAWHILAADVWASVATAGDLALPLFLVLRGLSLLAGGLLGFRVLMVWVYDRTGGSLLVAMLMHASYAASTFIINPVALSGTSLLVYDFVSTIAVWIVVAAIALAMRGQFLQESQDEVREHPRAGLSTSPHNIVRQPAWQRIMLLSVLGYEGAGALLGGSLLVAAPDGRLMDMPVDMMHGVFSDFLIPGLILIGLGILTTAAFVAVLRRTRTDWLLAGLALYGLAIWFIVEIVILRELHWLHAMWGLPVLAGCLVTLPLIPFRRTPGAGNLKTGGASLAQQLHE